LMLADLESMEKRVDTLSKKAKGNDKEAKEQLDLVNRALVLLREGKPARFVERKAEEERAFGLLGLMTAKPVLYVCNVEEASARDGNTFSAEVFKRAREEGAVAVVISAKIEAEIATLSREERKDFLDTLGIGSYAPTISMFKLWKLVPDVRPPGTLNVGHTPPTVALRSTMATRLSSLAAWIAARCGSILVSCTATLSGCLVSARSTRRCSQSSVGSMRWSAVAPSPTIRCITLSIFGAAWLSM